MLESSQGRSYIIPVKTNILQVKTKGWNQLIKPLYTFCASIARFSALSARIKLFYFESFVDKEFAKLVAKLPDVSTSLLS